MYIFMMGQRFLSKGVVLHYSIIEFFFYPGHRADCLISNERFTKAVNFITSGHDFLCYGQTSPSVKAH